jgi:hypothetical protein
MVGPGTLSSWDHTVEENRSIWDGWDWSRDGNEWTDDVRTFRGQDPEVWKASLLTAAMLPYAERGGTLVEIGPGAGRWTEHLQAVVGRRTSSTC